MKTAPKILYFLSASSLCLSLAAPAAFSMEELQDKGPGRTASPTPSSPKAPSPSSPKEFNPLEDFSSQVQSTANLTRGFLESVVAPKTHDEALENIRAARKEYQDTLKGIRQLKDIPEETASAQITAKKEALKDLTNRLRTSLRAHFGLQEERSSWRGSYWILSESFHAETKQKLEELNSLLASVSASFQRTSVLSQKAKTSQSYIQKAIKDLESHLEGLKGDARTFSPSRSLGFSSYYTLAESSQDLTFLTITPLNYGLYKEAMNFFREADSDLARIEDHAPNNILGDRNYGSTFPGNASYVQAYFSGLPQTSASSS